MKITVDKAVAAAHGLASLNETAKQTNLPMSLSMVIAHNARELDLIQKIYNERRDSILAKYAKPDKKTNGMTVSSKNVEAFKEAQKELSEEEVEIDARQVKASDFPLDFCPEPLALVALEWMILEE